MLFLFLNLLLSSLIIFLNHPISLGFLILLQTISTCNFIGLISMNFWFSYILILIMIGGLLILFIYMTSIASNEKFNFKIINSIIFILILMSLILTNKIFNIEFLNTNLLTSNIMEKKNFFFITSKFYNFPFINLIIITIIYLLISMIAVIKITFNKKTPLRQLF
uniref:NADH-ubiquinone oxidoreductase chain 6 n=1 Tax=Cucujoidea sp. 5 KM-2017 TaxID=2219386 RepID=A0A346RJL1_9CUCU|nr:NADH dehydrogenase subunit 6 [Cucujoidea sp. 5 KM-2017]